MTDKTLKRTVKEGDDIVIGVKKYRGRLRLEITTPENIDVTIVKSDVDENDVKPDNPDR